MASRVKQMVFIEDVMIVIFVLFCIQPLIFASDFRAFLDSAFSAASMDGSINGIAY